MRPRCAHAAAWCAKRAVLFAFDALCVTAIAVIALSGAPALAYAYVDPSVMTYTIQAVAGVAVALSAVAGVAFRKSRRRIMKLLNIDENAKKQTDPEWHRVTGVADNRYNACSAEEAPGSSGEAASKAASKAGRRDGALPLSRRFALAFAVSLLLVFTLLVMAPAEIVVGSAGDLQFTFSEVWLIVAGFALAALAVLVLILVVVPKKAFPVVLALVFALGLCFYVQAMFLNDGLPAADGRSVDWWGEFQMPMVVSAILWIAVFAASIAAVLIRVRETRVVMGIASIALVVVQAIGLVGLVSNQTVSVSDEEGSIAVTEAGLFEVSDKSNVIVFILDYYDTATLERVAAEHPEMLDSMEGFTWYRNSAGVMIPTGFALPYLLTAETPEKDQPIDDYVVTRWTDSTFLKDLKASGYSVGIYTPTYGFEYLTREQIDSQIYGNADNVRVLHEKEISPVGTVKALVKAALYRDMPWALKSRFRFYTDDINRQVVFIGDGTSPEKSVYLMDDARYYEKLKSLGLSVEPGESKGAFRMIHLNGDHFPYTLNSEGEFVGEGEATKEGQAIGAMGIVSYYLEELKDMGLYDNATVIITADHGDWEASMDLPDMATSPIMLYKAPHAGSDPVKVSDAPISHSDYFGTVLDAVGQDYAKYGTRFTDHAEDEHRVRDFYYLTHDADAQIRSLLGYTIDGDVNDFSNWTFTGDVWPCDLYNR